MDEMIKVIQLPVIEENLRQMAAEVDRKVNLAKSLVCTEETVKQVKKVRTELNKQLEELEEQRKAIKKAILVPYDNLNFVYKECVSDKFADAISQLTQQINEIEDALKKKKGDATKEYFDEYKQAVGIDWLTFDMAGLNITLSVSEKKLKESVREFVDLVSADLSVIEMQEDSTEILVEYQKSRNLSQSIQAVRERKEQLERMKAAEAEREAVESVKEEKAAAVEVLSAPKVEEELYKVTFSVTETKAKIKLLVDFMRANNIKFEQK